MKELNRLKPAAFLDRDGTINVDKEYLYRFEDFEYLDGAAEGLRQLQAWGYTLVVITNQSGIARGYYTEADYHRLTEWMLSDLAKKGIRIGGTYHCPHHPEGKIEKYAKSCSCRKPKTGLFYRAAEQLGLDLKQSIAIGDKHRDLEICRETGVKGFLLSGSGKEEAGCPSSQNRKDRERADLVSCKNWKEIVRCIGEMRKGE